MTNCLFAKSDMTPCVVKDGAVAVAFDSFDHPICVGCERWKALPIDDNRRTKYERQARAIDASKGGKR